MEKTDASPAGRVDFDKAKVRRWRRDVFRAFQREGFRPPEIMAASVLAGIIAVGPDPAVLSALTGLTDEYIRTVTKRLRAHRVLRGQSVRAAWMRDDAADGGMGAILDGMVAAGLLSRRHVDPKRSAAQKARKPETRARGPRGPRIKIEPRTIAPPKIVASDPYYGLPEWDKDPSAK